MSGSTTPAQRITAFAVHLFTASGAVAAFLALAAAMARDFASMFAWLAAALFIDGVDGTLARAAQVKKHAGWIDGDVLDFVVDFLTYVFVPVVGLWQSGIMGPDGTIILCPLVVGASALYFADRRMKTRDNWFRGFPALWNIAALYLLAFSPPPLVCAAIVLALTALMFAPVYFAHPLRVESLRALTLAMTIVWSASAVLLIAEGFDHSPVGKIGLVVTAVYFIGLSVRRSFAGGAAP